MKKLFLTLAVAFVALSAYAGAGIVRPIEVNWDLNNLPDGEYAVSFSPAHIVTTAKGNYIDFEIYSLDLFDAQLVKQLAIGDCIIYNDEVVEVKTIKKEDDGYISINYGMEGMTDFELYDDTRYRICGDDDHATYTSQGIVKLLVPITASMTDSGIDGDPELSKEIKGAKLGHYLRNSWSDDFFEINTSITIKKGKIVKLNRYYIP